MKNLQKETLNLKYKNVLAKGYAPNWSIEIFVITKNKITMSWTCVISDLNGEKTVASFYKKELERTKQKEFRIEKLLKV